jgi:hypothetical protein
MQWTESALFNGKVDERKDKILKGIDSRWRGGGGKKEVVGYVVI